MTAYNPELRTDQIEIYLGTDGAVPLANLRSLFYQLERIANRKEYFDGTVQLALSAARPGSLGLVFDVQQKIRSRAVVLRRAARALLAEQERIDPRLEERIAIAAERSAEAAERSADAAERSASSSERTTQLTERILYATVAAVLVPIIAQEIRGGELSAPIVKIDQQFDLREVRIQSAANGQWIPDNELPDERMLDILRNGTRSERRELLALKERKDIDYLLQSQGYANVVGRFVFNRGRVYMTTRYGNELQIDVNPSNVPIGVDVFAVIERGTYGYFIPTRIDKIDHV